MLKNFSAQNVNFCLDKKMGEQQFISHFGLKDKVELEREIDNLYKYNSNKKRDVKKAIKQNTKVYNKRENNSKAKVQKFEDIKSPLDFEEKADKIQNESQVTVEKINLEKEVEKSVQKEKKEIDNTAKIDDTVEVSEEETLRNSLDKTVNEMIFFENERTQLLQKKCKAIIELNSIYNQLSDLNNIIKKYKEYAIRYSTEINDTNSKLKENSEFINLCKEQEGELRDKLLKYEVYTLVCDTEKKKNYDNSVFELEIDKQKIMEKFNNLLDDSKTSVYAEEIKGISLKQISKILIAVSEIEKNYNKKTQLIFESKSEVTDFLANILKMNITIED